MSLLVNTSVRSIHDASDLFTAQRQPTVRPGWVTPRAAFQSLLTGAATLVDIRTAAQRSTGTVPSRFGPVIAGMDQLRHFDPTSAVIVLAEADEEADRTARLLRSRGVSAVALSGGVAAWRAVGMPLT